MNLWNAVIVTYITIARKDFLATLAEPGSTEHDSESEITAPDVLGISLSHCCIATAAIETEVGLWRHDCVGPGAVVEAIRVPTRLLKRRTLPVRVGVKAVWWNSIEDKKYNYLSVLWNIFYISRTYIMKPRWSSFSSTLTANKQVGRNSTSQTSSSEEYVKTWP